MTPLSHDEAAALDAHKSGPNSFAGWQFGFLADDEGREKIAWRKVDFGVAPLRNPMRAQLVHLPTGKTIATFRYAGEAIEAAESIAQLTHWAVVRHADDTLKARMVARFTALGLGRSYEVFEGKRLAIFTREILPSESSG